MSGVIPYYLAVIIYFRLSCYKYIDRNISCQVLVLRISYAGAAAWTACRNGWPLENREHLVHLACFMPFDKVAEMMEEIVSVQTNEETVRRLTERIGSWMEAAQTAEVDAGGELEPEDEPPLQRCVFQCFIGW